jgi:recombination protein RecT
MSQEKSLQTADKSVKALFANEKVKAKFEEILGKKSAGFMASVLQIASLNLPKDIEPNSVMQSALMAATLDLPINNNLGFAYIVSYNQRQPDGSYKKVAQFQANYRSFVQLAQRTGQFKTISAAPIYEGQLKSSNPLTGYEFDFSKKDSDTVIGFAAYFSLLNGFEKTLFMDVNEMKAHGLKYSKTYSNGLWQTNFIGMGQKTVLKLLLSKFAPLSIEMQKAITADQAVINDVDTDDVTYVDNSYEEVEIDHEAERVRLMIEDCKSAEELTALLEQVDMTEEQMLQFENKMKELKKSKK